MAKGMKSLVLFLILVASVIGLFMYFGNGESFSTISTGLSGSGCQEVKFSDENGNTYATLTDLSSRIEQTTGQVVSLAELQKVFVQKGDGVYTTVCSGSSR